MTPMKNLRIGTPLMMPLHTVWNISLRFPPHMTWGLWHLPTRDVRCFMGDRRCSLPLENARPPLSYVRTSILVETTWIQDHGGIITVSRGPAGTTNATVYYPLVAHLQRLHQHTRDWVDQSSIHLLVFYCGCNPLSINCLPLRKHCL